MIAWILGVPADMADTFTGWVRDVLEFAYDERRRVAGRQALVAYLSQHLEQRRDDPQDDLISVLLRAYSPVTMARIVAEDTEFKGCPMKAGDRVLMNFPGANRDPEAFERADEVVLDRALNRHLAFGAGIHRCAGSNLARMELTVALEEWLRRMPEFRLADGAEVTWAGGQVRGPRSIPVVFGGSA